MNNREIKTTTKMDGNDNPTVGTELIQKSRPRLLGGKVFENQYIDRSSNNMKSEKTVVGGKGNIISSQVTDYNKIPFKNKAIDAINRVDRHIGNYLNTVAYETAKEIKNAVPTLKTAAHRVKNMVDKNQYKKGDNVYIGSGNPDVPWEGDQKKSSRPTLSGGDIRRDVINMGNGNKKIIKTKFDQNQDIVKQVTKQKKTIKNK